MISSTAEQRRSSSSTSWWLSAAASTRASTRRRSVMRMPLALHRASMSLGFGAFTTLLRAIAISRQGAEIHWISNRKSLRGRQPVQRLLPITPDRGEEQGPPSLGPTHSTSFAARFPENPHGDKVEAPRRCPHRPPETPTARRARRACAHGSRAIAAPTLALARWRRQQSTESLLRPEP